MANGARTKDLSTELIFKSQYRDEYTSEPLPASWVEAAIQEKIGYFNARVWVGVPLKVALAGPDAKIIGCRWVISNKNDPSNPDIRTRLVAQEISAH